MLKLHKTCIPVLSWWWEWRGSYL